MNAAPIFDAVCWDRGALLVARPLGTLDPPRLEFLSHESDDDASHAAECRRIQEAWDRLGDDEHDDGTSLSTWSA